MRSIYLGITTGLFGLSLVCSLCFAEQRITPYEIVSFYSSNYPDSDNNQKAEFIMDSLKKNKWEARFEDVVKVTVIKKIIWNGIVIWPIDYNDKPTMQSSLTSIKDTANKIAAVDKNNVTVCSSCTKGGKCDIPTNK